tara:strand:+ start:416 stop:946 length:531 start_codon:yes stop_codon:yes gene_type:complete
MQQLELFPSYFDQFDTIVYTRLFDAEQRIKFTRENPELIAGDDNSVLSSWICELMACSLDGGEIMPVGNKGFDYLYDGIHRREVKTSSDDEGRGRVKFTGLFAKQNLCDLFRFIQKHDGRHSDIPHDKLFEKDDKGSYKYVTKAGVFENTPGHKNNELFDKYSGRYVVKATNPHKT